MYTVLSLSRNTRLLLERHNTLAMAGFRVVSPRNPEEAPFLALQKNVDAVIIGHSIEPANRAVLMKTFRRICPACLVVFVYTYPQSQGDPHADLSVDVTKGSHPLIDALQARLPRRAAA
jgi:hypothetical protein